MIRAPGGPGGLIFLEPALFVNGAADDNGEIVRIEVTLGDTINIFASYAADQLRVTGEIIEAEFEYFRFHQEARHLRIRLETKNEATSKIIERVFKLALRHRFHRDTANLVKNAGSCSFHIIRRSADVSDEAARIK